MNRLNPLYVGFFLLLLLVFFSMKLIDTKKELQEEKILYKKTLNIAIQTSALKKAFANKKKGKREILRILAYPLLKNAKITKRVTSSGIHINAKNMDKNMLNFFMGKILNATFNITMLQIKKINENKAKLEVRIKW